MWWVKNCSSIKELSQFFSILIIITNLKFNDILISWIFRIYHIYINLARSDYRHDISSNSKIMLKMNLLTHEMPLIYLYYFALIHFIPATNCIFHTHTLTHTMLYKFLSNILCENIHIMFIIATAPRDGKGTKNNIC